MSTFRMVEAASGWRLERDGDPFPVNGAVGRVYLERLVRAGGNAIRAGVAELDGAGGLGLAVLVGLPFGKQRWGFDYCDRAAAARQLEEIEAIVRRHCHHPALMMWALGNELEIHTTAGQREPLWSAVNEAAEAIHRIDPDHPVITVVGCDFIDQRILPELDLLCPALDAVGLNAYNDMLRLPECVQEQGWRRPYIVTEFGPRGHWQVPKTAWGMPVEDTSTEKATFYGRAWRHAVAGARSCLGGFAFHWGHHHEKTHTWYGMFLEDGSATAAVETMQTTWSGHAPADRCPRTSRIEVAGSGEDGVFAAGSSLSAYVRADDPDGDPLRVTWDLRADVAGNPNVGGDREQPTPPIDGAIIRSGARDADVLLPDRPGPYRLFVYAHDGRGWAATANVPLLAE